MKNRTKIIVLSIGFFLALVLILYPFLSVVYNNYREQQLVADYDEQVSQISEEDYSEMIAAATAWNEELYAYIEPSYFPDGITDDEIYESLLNIDGTGMMGYVVIEKINVNLPIYHYTTDEVLLRGAGHMSASSLPVGGENTHCVITAHRGLPTATMFTDLDQLEIGDTFYLKILNEILTYEVIEIQTVTPSDTTSLLPQAGEDLCTLVTCTPYGVNSHRLLVTGTRIETPEDANVPAETTAVSAAAESNWYLLIVAALEILVYIFLLVRILREDKKKNNAAKEEKNNKKTENTEAAEK